MTFLLDILYLVIKKYTGGIHMKYEVKGEPLPVVICSMESGEQIVSQSGAMVWMTPNMEMSTSVGGAKKGFTRMFSGESMFQNIYTAKDGDGLIAFGTSVPGRILALEITPDRPVICQKSAFLAAEPGVELSIFFQKKGMSGFFSGEGFIMQKLSGNGIAFVEIDGSTVEYELAAGQSMILDTGNLALCDATCTIDVQSVKGFKNKMFGGEGFFNTAVTGPGKIVLQTMTLNGLAGALIPFLSSGNNN